MIKFLEEEAKPYISKYDIGKVEVNYWNEKASSGFVPNKNQLTEVSVHALIKGSVSWSSK